MTNTVKVLLIVVVAAVGFAVWGRVAVNRDADRATRGNECVAAMGQEAHAAPAQKADAMLARVKACK